jgi:hypothetical protein
MSKGLSSWAGKKGGGIPHIVVERHADGTRVTEHPSKQAAHEHGMALRREGRDVAVHSVAFANKFGLDPRKTEGGGSHGGGSDEFNRDENGRFASK